MFDVAKLSASSHGAIAKVQALEEATRAMEQVEIETSHVLHAGMYARTIKVPKGILITGALVKIATTLVIYGDVTVYLDGEPVRLTGHCVLAASAYRKQAFFAHEDTWITMIFKTESKTIEDCEKDFTDDYAELMSNSGSNKILITGE